jgi:hypothetical protein
MTAPLFPERNAEILRHHDTGLEPCEIAKEMGLNRDVVIGVLHRAGRCKPLVRREEISYVSRLLAAEEAAELSVKIRDLRMRMGLR